MGFIIFYTTCLYNTRECRISLKDIRALIQESKTLAEAKPAFKQHQFLLELVSAYVEDYSGRHANFLQVLNRTKEKLQLENAQTDLVFFNLEAANFSKANGYISEAKLLYYENEGILKNYAQQPKPFNFRNMPIENVNALGVVYQMELNLDSAEWYFKRALERSLEAKDTAWIGINSGNLGNVLFNKGNLVDAEKLLLVDKEYSISKEVFSSAINAIFTIIDIKIKQGNFTEVQNLLVESKVLRDKEKYPNKEFYQSFDIRYETRLAKVMFNKAKVQEAMVLFNQVIDVLEDRNEELYQESLKPNRGRYLIEENALLKG